MECSRWLPLPNRRRSIKEIGYLRKLLSLIYNLSCIKCLLLRAVESFRGEIGFWALGVRTLPWILSKFNNFAGKAGEDTLVLLFVYWDARRDKWIAYKLTITWWTWSNQTFTRASADRGSKNVSSNCVLYLISMAMTKKLIYKKFKEGTTGFEPKICRVYTCLIINQIKLVAVGNKSQKTNWICSLCELFDLSHLHVCFCRFCPLGFRVLLITAVQMEIERSWKIKWHLFNWKSI